MADSAMKGQQGAHPLLCCLGGHQGLKSMHPTKFLGDAGGSGHQGVTKDPAACSSLPLVQRLWLIEQLT